MTTVPVAALHRSNLARAVAIDIVCVAALVVACAWQLYDLERVLDLAPWDEADYVRRGLAIPSRGLPQAEWGPLYAIWYFLLALVQPDPIALFYLSYRSLVILPTLALFACARRVGVSSALALLGSLLFLLSEAPHILPRPTLLALLIIVVALAAAAPLRRFEAGCAVIGLGLLFGAFARPELFLSFLIESAVLGGAVFLRVRRSKGQDVVRWSGLVAGYTAVSLALVAVFGNPLGRQDGRRLYAFCQHFAVGEVKRERLPLDPWGQCEAVMHRAFGEVRSVGEAARRNPSAFWTHALENLRQYPAASGALVLGESESSPWGFGHRCALALLAAWAMWAVARSGRGLVGAARSPCVLRAGLLLTAVLVPSIASAILIQPRSHYLVLQSVVAPLFVVTWLSKARARLYSRGGLAADIGAVALAMAVSAAAPHWLRRSPTQSRLPNLEVVRYLKSQAANVAAAPDFAPIGLLELEGGYDAYVMPRFRRVSPVERRPSESFMEFIRRRGVRVVVLSPRLAAHHRMAGDPEFRAFTAAPEAFGFSAQKIASTDRIVAVARDPEPKPGRRASIGADLPVPTCLR